MNRRRFDEALKLYLRQEKAGDPTALPSIRRAAAKALDDPEALQRVARSPEARPIFTAWVLSVWNPQNSEDPLETGPARKWLAAIQSAGISQVESADRLAWVAYLGGDFAAAEAWAKRAPADAPMARWIRAKLLLRAGKVAEAEALLAQVRPTLPAGPGPDHDLWQSYEAQGPAAVRPRAAGELGAVRLARGEYAAALDDLLRGGWWTDAAYVAERVLTVEELRAYVDKTCPAALAARYDPDKPRDEDQPGYAWRLQFAGLVAPSDEQISYDLRDLLGRRLARAGRLADARPYLPEPRRAALDDFAQSLAQGRDGARPAADRSRRSSAPPASPAIRAWSCSAPRSSLTGASTMGDSRSMPSPKRAPIPRRTASSAPRPRSGGEWRGAAPCRTSGSITGIGGWIWPRKRRSCCPAPPRRGRACSPPPATGSRERIPRAPGRSTTPFRAAAPIPRSPAARARSTRSRMSRTPARRM